MGGGNLKKVLSCQKTKLGSTNFKAKFLKQDSCLACFYTSPQKLKYFGGNRAVVVELVTGSIKP